MVAFCDMAQILYPRQHHLGSSLAWLKAKARLSYSISISFSFFSYKMCDKWRPTIFDDFRSPYLPCPTFFTLWRPTLGCHFGPPTYPKIERHYWTFLSHSFLTKRAQTTDYSWRGPLWRVGWQEPRPYLAQPTMDAVKLHIWPKKGVRVHLGGSQKSNVSRKDVIIFRSADWLLNSLSCNSGLKAVSKVGTLV